MKVYAWKNLDTREVIETDDCCNPPDLPGIWKRVFSLGFGRVEGAGETPPRYVP